MANEIRVLEGGADTDATGRRVFNLLMLFPIATPQTITPPGGAASNVVPTPASGLPPLAVQSTTASERAELDAGTLVFRVLTLTKDPALSNAQLAAAAQQKYATQRAAVDAEYSARYRHTGTMLDAP
jgi:hypothetical protein